MNFNFNNQQTVLIFGLGDIGSALKEELEDLFTGIKIYGVTTNDLKASENVIRIKSYSEENIKELSERFHSIDAIINTIGSLNVGNNRPEKSLKDFSAESLKSTIEINTVVSGLIAKYFYKRFKQEQVCLFSTLSALVGSISENELGGWYSYRISKAALNMLMKNISLEVKRIRPNLIINTVHPGTTETKLSKNYLKGIQHQILTPKQCAERLIYFYEELTLKDSGTFFHANGKKIPY